MDIFGGKLSLDAGTPPARLNRPLGAAFGPQEMSLVFFFSLDSLESLELLRQDELAAAVNVVHDLLLEQSQLVPEDISRGNQLRVLAL